MAKLARTTTSVLNWLKRFTFETLASFGLVTVLRAVMVPPVLSLVIGVQHSAEPL